MEFFERQFVSAFESAPIGMALVAPDGRWLRVNRALRQIMAWETEDLDTVTFQDVTHPDDLEKDLDYVRKMLAGELDTYQMEKRYIRADRKVVNALLSVSLVRDELGQPVHFISQIQDITEQRQMEAELRQAQKLEAIGLLAAGIAHDFNNILAVIMGHADAAMDNLDEPRFAREDLLELQRATTRAGQLTRQLLAFGRKQQLSPKVTNLSAHVRDMGKMLRALVGDEIELILPTIQTAGEVVVDPSQVGQIVMNLVVNARDATRRGGCVSVDVSSTPIDEVLGPKLGARPGPYMVITVADNGSGMDRATQLRIFEPFFTTKPLGAGTGLGLSTVFGIVKQSGGHITVESDLGHGSTFRVYLPRTDRIAQGSGGTSGSSSLEGNETILLADSAA